MFLAFFVVVRDDESKLTSLLFQSYLRLMRYSGSSTNQKISGLIRSSSSPHVDVSLGKILNPEVPLMGGLLPCKPQCMDVRVNG